MIIKVKVKARARKESLIAKAADRLEISVKEKAEQGAANERVLALVAEHYALPRKRVRLTRGHTTPSKLIQLL